MFTLIWHDCICPFTTKYLFYSYKRLTVLKEKEHVKVPQAIVHELTGQPVEIAVSAAFVSFLKYCKSSGEKMLNKKNIMLSVTCTMYFLLRRGKSQMCRR